jgi:hypothetical protein
MGAMDRSMQIKVGAFLTNLMCKNLKYKIGKQNFLLLQPTLMRNYNEEKNKNGSKLRKTVGYVSFNKAFIE